MDGRRTGSIAAPAFRLRRVSAWLTQPVLNTTALRARDPRWCDCATKAAVLISGTPHARIIALQATTSALSTAVAVRIDVARSTASAFSAAQAENT
jgi:hypothetical protein